VRGYAKSFADVMAITKCLIWVLSVNRFTGATRTLREGGDTSDISDTWSVRGLD